ncbi:MAG: 2-C-methyl-D-erythritol 4-phosphate cytidylyltransferase, partial [Selenomonadaceae bacterium]|nr:2-C-methyl-D-erythritol 4-phosphate cytidylyltransferase [Selenomonadaceae bacterium]
PLVTVQTIDGVINAAEKFGGAIAAVPAKDTIKIVGADGFVRFTPPRRELSVVQTPQGFRREILLRAYEKAAEENFLGTDDSSLVERLGVRIKIITSTYDNIKVTTPEDIHVAETVLQKEIC